MKRTMKNVLAGLSALLLTTSAIAADKKVVLKMFDEQFRGQNTISIKRELRGQFPSLNLRRFSLDTVVLVAKSRVGRGKATLEVNRMQSFNHLIDGFRDEFHNRDAYTFNRIKINNPAYSSRGQWDLHLKGNIKVRKIIVKLNRVRNHDNVEPSSRVRFTEVDSLQFSKVFDEVKRVRVATNNVKVIKIVAKRSAIRILDVEVVFKNGNTRFLSELEGIISEGDTKEIQFRRTRDIRALRITAVARRASRSGGSGVLKVSVGKQRR